MAIHKFRPAESVTFTASGAITDGQLVVVSGVPNGLGGG